jgi:hypothetical protein
VLRADAVPATDLGVFTHAREMITQGDLGGAGSCAVGGDGEYLGYEKGDPAGPGQWEHPQRHLGHTALTDSSVVDVDVPQDCNWDFHTPSRDAASSP